MRRRIVRWVVVLFVGVVAVLSLLLALENRLVYFPTPAADDWEDSGDLHARDLTLDAGGTPVHAWWCPCDDATGALVYAHGNGGNLSHRAETYRGLRDRHRLSVLAFDYPGYGKSGGTPSEAGCYAAGAAAYDWVTGAGGIPAGRVVLFGESLGGGVAVELAARRPCRAVVLRSAFTSIPDVGHDVYPFLPCRTLMRNRFENLRKLPAVRCPVFVAHGDADELVPVAHARRLFAAANEPKKLYLEPGGGHNMPLSEGFHTALKRFLTAQSDDRPPE